MPMMTDEEADALDELWTRTTPEIDMTRPGFLTRKGFTMVSLDAVSAVWLRARAETAHQTMPEVIGDLVREKIAASMSNDIANRSLLIAPPYLYRN